MNILTIDTSKPSRISIYLEQDLEKHHLENEQKFGSQVLLQLIEQVLSMATITFSDLTEVNVITGPGSYTGLRVGAAVANALGYSLGIPVNGKKMEVDLIYG